MIYRKFGGAVAAVMIASVSFIGSEVRADDAPYLVSGNKHVIVGITLDEAAVRAALPEGLEPAEGVTGGINVYHSGGGTGVAGYERTYIWADLAGFDSVSGAKGRYILWLADSAHAQKMAKIGYQSTAGVTSLAEDGKTVTGTTTLAGAEAMKVVIELADGECGPAIGTLNYPSVPAGSGGLAVTQYAFSAKICGAAPVSVDVTVADDHPLAKFKPQSVVWAVLARDLSFSGSPQFALKTGANE